MTHELKTGGDKGYLRIATEEAFATQEQLDAIMRLVREGRADEGTMSLWGFYGTSMSERSTFIRERLLDLGELRIGAMDDAGIDKAVLALTSPGTQSMHDVDEARRIASENGVVRIEEIKLDDGKWEIEGRDSTGAEIEVDLRASDGVVIKMERDRPASAATRP